MDKKTTYPNPYNKNTSGGVSILTALLCVVIGALFIGGFWIGGYLFSDRIIYGVKCRHLDLSGLDPTAAATMIARDSKTRLSRNALILVHDSSFQQVGPADIDLAVDAPATAQKALAIGRDGGLLHNLMTAVDAALHKKTILPVISYDRDKLAEIVRPFSESVDQPVRDAALDLGEDGAITRQKASPGKKVMTDDFLALLEERLAGLDFPQRVALEPRTAAPKIKDSDLAPIDARLASFSVQYPGEAGAAAFAEKLAARLHQRLLPPKKRLSFNKEIISGDKNVRNYPLASDIVSSALYGAAVHAGLGITEREAGDGTEPLPGVEPGFMAYAHGDGGDVIIENRFNTPVYFLAKAGGGSLSVDVLGAAGERGGRELEVDVSSADCPHDPRFAITTIRRRYVEGGETVSDELLAEDRVMKMEYFNAEL